MSEEQKISQRGSFTAYYKGNDVSVITTALNNTLFAKAHDSMQQVTTVNTTYIDDDNWKCETIKPVKK